MEGTFDFDKSSSESKIVGQFLQRYYGVTVDILKQGYGPEAWIIDEDVDQVRQAQVKRGPLVFIDSVVYGRAAYFFTETKKSDLDVAATLNAAYSGGSVEASADVSTKFKESFASDNLRVVSIGGGNEDGAIVSTIDEFKEMVSRKPSSTGLGDAIAYTVRFVDDQSIAMVNVATTYPERTCTELKNTVKFGIDEIKVNLADDEGTDNRIELYANAMVSVTYDAFENGQWVEKFIAPKTLTLEPGNLGDTGNVVKGIDRYLEFEIPDDPVSEEVNEVKTARFNVQWLLVYEPDSTSSHDFLAPVNANDSSRMITLTQAEKGFSRPYFRFRGADQSDPDADIEMHFYLKPGG